MGLWLDSLVEGGRAPDGATEPERLAAAARHILQHLAMYLPRSYWDAALARPEELSPAFVGLVGSLRSQLLRVPELAGLVSFPALVALPYTHEVGLSGWQVAAVWQRHSLAGFVAATGAVLAARPELWALGERVA